MANAGHSLLSYPSLRDAITLDGSPSRSGARLRRSGTGRPDARSPPQGGISAVRSTVPTMRPPVLIADFVNAPGHAERHIGVGQIGWAAGGRLVGAQSAVPLRDGGNDRSQSPVHRWGRECGRRRAGPKRSKTRCSVRARHPGPTSTALKAKHIDLLAPVCTVRMAHAWKRQPGGQLLARGTREGCALQHPGVAARPPGCRKCRAVSSTGTLCGANPPGPHPGGHRNSRPASAAPNTPRARASGAAVAAKAMRRQRVKARRPLVQPPSVRQVHAGTWLLS